MLTFIESWYLSSMRLWRGKTQAGWSHRSDLLLSFIGTSVSNISTSTLIQILFYVATTRLRKNDQIRSQEIYIWFQSILQYTEVGCVSCEVNAESGVNDPGQPLVDIQVRSINISCSKYFCEARCHRSLLVNNMPDATNRTAPVTQHHWVLIEIWLLMTKATTLLASRSNQDYQPRYVGPDYSIINLSDTVSA